MRILMLGWEFPPRIAGGLGTACFGLTRALDRLGHEVCFVLPDPVGAGRIERAPGMAHATLVRVAAGFTNPYGRGPDRYGTDLISEAQRYAALVAAGPWCGPFDVIHAHDWLTFPAGLALASLSGRPLVVHIHSTEQDRSGGQAPGPVGRAAEDVERMAVRAADRIIAVSGVTRAACIGRYGADPSLVDVVHNGIDGRDRAPAPERRADAPDRVVLYMGRIVAQKGPAHFLHAGAKLLARGTDLDRPIRLVMAGDGDLRADMEALAARLGIEGRVEFPGFLRGPAVSRALAGSDVLVMTSQSEPFGLAATEAVRQGVPVVLPPCAGASEVLTRAPMRDPSDHESLAESILMILEHPSEAAAGVRAMQAELRPHTWKRAALGCLHAYHTAALETRAWSRA